MPNQILKSSSFFLFKVFCRCSFIQIDIIYEKKKQLRGQNIINTYHISDEVSLIHAFNLYFRFGFLLTSKNATKRDTVLKVDGEQEGELLDDDLVAGLLW